MRGEKNKKQTDITEKTGWSDTMGLTVWQRVLLGPYNKVAASLSKENKLFTDWKELKQVVLKSKENSDISSHMVRIFIETVKAKPKLIIELGTKRGCSTYALSQAAIVTNANLISVDIKDCSKSSEWENWVFVQMDDIVFSKQFVTWCKQRKINPVIDVLFIDTSHTYDHTKKEIAAFFPYLSKNAKVIFHDTNCSDWYRRTNKTIDRSYDAKRGVIKPIEEYFGKEFNEKERFIEFINGWLIDHDPICNGLTILKKIKVGG